jgi:hypothetical protein
MKKFALIALTITVLLAAVAFGAVQETKQPMKQELVKLNYVRGNDIMPLLGPLRSREGHVEMASNGTAISISDYPENVAKMLEVIKEMDVKPPDVLFTIQLVLASEDGTGRTDEALANDPIIKELRGFLKYKSFSLLDTSLVRALNPQSSEVVMGPKGEFNLELRPYAVNAGAVQVFVRLRQRLGLAAQESEAERAGMVKPSPAAAAVTQTLIESSLSMKSGDKTVVGVSRTAGGDKGLILIIQAKVVG